jgi:large subunit ribosomal protein L25
MEKVKVSCQPREIGKKTKTKNLRDEGKIPCVLYGMNDNIHFSTIFNEVKSLIFTPNFKLAELEIDGKVYNALIKEVQFHPVTDDIQHIDFLAVLPGKTVIADIPVRTQGTAPGIMEGGLLRKKLRKLRVKVPTESLVDQLTIDVSELRMGDISRVKDIEVPEGMKILVDTQIPVVSIDKPRKAIEIIDEEAEEEGESAQGEA